MCATDVDHGILAIGDDERIDTIANEMRARGHRTTVARSLSEVRTALSVADLPALVILDARAQDPWRADALARITAFVRAASVSLVWIGGGARGDTRARNVRRLPVDTAVVEIAAVACALLASDAVQQRAG